MKGIVLAGGRSTRMGEDKAFLKLDHRYFWQIAVDVLTTQCSEVYISINEEQAGRFDVPEIIDTKPDQGPLGGILSCLEVLKEDLVFIPVDGVSFPPIGLIPLINSTAELTAYRHASGMWEGLFSKWRSTQTPLLNAFIQTGERKVQTYLNQHASPVEVKHQGWFKNVNRPEDYRKIKLK